jgi:hypothetical protein
MRAALLAVVLAMGCRITLDEREVPSQCTAREDIPVCKEAESHSDFTWLQDHVFSSNCSGDSCHNAPKNGQPPGGRITLTMDAYATLMGTDGMGVKSQIASDDRWLVDPGGNAENSYLYFLLRGIYPEQGQPPFVEPPDDVGYMPQGQMTLCCQKIEAVRRWIEAGAKND